MSNQAGMKQRVRAVDVFDPAIDLCREYFFDFSNGIEPSFRLVISPAMFEVLCARAPTFARRRPASADRFEAPAIDSAAPWGYGGCARLFLADQTTAWYSFVIPLPANGAYALDDVLHTIDVVARTLAYAESGWRVSAASDMDKQSAVLRSVVLPRLDDSAGGIDLRVCAPLQQWLKMHGVRAEVAAIAALRRTWEFTSRTHGSGGSSECGYSDREAMRCIVDTDQGLLRAVSVPGAQAVGGLHVPPDCEEQLRSSRGYEIESTNLTSSRKIVTALAGFCAVWGAASPAPPC